MSMLIRAGLPSRRAAMVAVVDGDADYFDSAGMRAWLESEGIVDRTAAGDWPTEETAALWGRFHSEALSDAIQRWRRVVGVRPFLDDVYIEPGTYRIERDEAADENLLVTADYRRVSRLGGAIRFTSPSLFMGVVDPNAPVVRIERLGRGLAL